MVALARAVSTVSGDRATDRESQLSLVDQIVAETGCNRRKAEGFIKFLRRVASKARRDGYDPIHVTGRDFSSYHDLLDQVMPDDTVAATDSLHERLDRELLDLNRGELAFMHGKDGVSEDCAVTVEVRRVS